MRIQHSKQSYRSDSKQKTSESTYIFASESTYIFDTISNIDQKILTNHNMSKFYFEHENTIVFDMKKIFSRMIALIFFVL